MSDAGSQLLLEEAPPAEVQTHYLEPSGEADAALPAPPEPAAPWPPPARMIDGFLELLAYTRYLASGSLARPVGHAEGAAHVRQLLDRAEAFRLAHGFPEEAWQEALFAVCAWVDEQILCSSWEGREPWGTDQLQRQRFGTTQAGEAFFDRLEALGDEAWQVREVYDYCLSLGFQGRYFGPGGQEPLRGIRAAQLERLPLALRSGLDPHLFPDAGQTLPGEPVHRHLPYRYLVYLALAAIPPALFLILFLGFRTFLDNLVRPLLQ